MRGILALYLSLVATLGPWLCCCTAARLTPHSAELISPRKAPAAPACCCCSQTETSREQPVNDAPLAPATPPCSCHQERPDAVLATVDGEMSVQPAELLNPLCSLVVGAASATLDAAATQLMCAPRECIAFPHRDPVDILRLLHLMLC